MKFIKKNAKYIGIVMICIFCSYLTTIATNYIFDSSDVRFDNTGTSLESVNVQDAIDETFHHVTDYNEIKTTIGNSTLTTTNKTLIGGINEVNSNLGLPSSASGVNGADAFSKINTLNGKITNDFGKVLWTNPSPTSDFADGFLSVPDVNKYRIILIHFLSRKDNPEDYSSTYVAYIGQKGILKYDNLFRLFSTYTSIAQIHFQEGGEGGVGFDNKYIIPLKIVGIL